MPRAGAWAVFERANRIKPESVVHAQLVRQAAAEVVAEDQAAAWLATLHRFACPRCVPEIRQQILDGKLPHEILLNEKVGEIKARSSSATARS